jgi:hypothetical protein
MTQTTNPTKHNATTPEALQAQFPKLSAEAAHILAMPGNAYWRPRTPDVRVEAVAFAQPRFLAGPFEGKFGLVYIEHKPDARPMQEQLDQLAHRMMDDCSTTYMPYPACARLNKVFPNGTRFHWDAVDQTSYSDIDLPYLSVEVRSRLDTEGNRCQLFAATPEGKIELMEQLTAAEQDAFVAAKQKALESCRTEMAQTEACAERPYRVRLQGNDDFSWTVSLSSEADVDALLQELRQFGEAAVHRRMAFTN